MRGRIWIKHFGWVLLSVCLIQACQLEQAPLPERPRDPWVIRSVLDQQIRMVTLALHEDFYVAYNTQNCALYKVWKGGVHWDGAAFNNVKTVQPQSWGLAYWETEPAAKPWRLLMNGVERPVKPQFKGYKIEQDQITFAYEVQSPNGAMIRIFEQPEFIPEDDKGFFFSRSFQLEGLAGDVVLKNGDIELAGNGERNLAFYYEFLPSVNPADFTRQVSGSGSQYWLDRSGCNTCHEENEYTIGPAYQAIAAKYEDNGPNFDYLVRKVKQGGSGVWGKVPMQAHPDLPEDDIEGMIDYILSLKPSDRELEEEEDEDWEEEERQGVRPGFGASLAGLHPSLELTPIRLEAFKPRVGGMDFLSDGTLLVSTWDSIGAVYALRNVTTGDSNLVTIQRMAGGLSEPLGLKLVEDEVFVLQKHELTQLVDMDGDGVAEEYRTLCNSFGATPDFHEFSYGLEYKDGYFYANLGLAMRLMSEELQHPERGTTIKISRDGSYEIMVTGLRQPNGIGKGPDGNLFTTENQGQWVPACKVIHLQEGDFHGCAYGMGDRYQAKTMVPPAVWLPQDEIGNSPGQPVFLPEGPYAGQLLHGEVTHGGLKRVFLEKVNGRYQGAVFRFTQGLEAGINRAVWGPDGALYVGGVGMNGNWGWKGKQYGLQRLAFTDQVTFEILEIRALPNGFKLTFTEPLAEDLEVDPGSLQIRQWWYETTAAYGGPKMDLEKLEVTDFILSADRKSVQLSIPGLKKEHVVYFLLDPDLWLGASGQSLWTGEAWYTLNAIPN